ncbi:hypothetical protein [Cypionkella sp.]|uniref:hypothetical protein n=1 Tax=Cypionkella sp. TaxID=2811411 RepID=UPI0027260F7C|nr:hypothetical protein [Cypionkella sp.]MDO8983028.1 hypothetical protein [Cypionkella sp.]
MKIWSLVINDDDSSFEPSLFFSEADADEAAWDWVLGAWISWFGNVDAPSNWEQAANKLYEQVGFMNSITLTEHDISAHPAAVQADGALNNCLDQLHLLADLANCRDEDVENAILDANTALDMLAGNDPAEDEPDAAQLHQIEQDRITEAWLDKPAVKPVITLDNIRDQLRARWSANLPVVDAIQERAVRDPEYAADVALWLTGEKSTVHLRDRIVEPIRQLPHIVAIGKQFNPTTEWDNTWVPLDTAAHLARNSLPHCVTLPHHGSEGGVADQSTDTAASDALTEAGYYEGPWTEPAPEMNEYLFDVQLISAIRVKARNEQSARAEVVVSLECTTANLGAFGNGDPIIAEVSVDSIIGLAEINGEEVGLTHEQLEAVLAEVAGMSRSDALDWAQRSVNESHSKMVAILKETNAVQPLD